MGECSESKDVVVTDEECIQSQDFPLDNVSVPIEISCGNIHMGAVISAMPAGVFNRSKFVTIYPFFVCVNNLRTTVRVLPVKVSNAPNRSSATCVEEFVAGQIIFELKPECAQPIYTFPGALSESGIRCCLWENAVRAKMSLLPMKNVSSRKIFLWTM